MKSTTSIRSVLTGLAITFALASAAHATATRTYVSNAGVDSNTATNCPHSAPCKTFAAAYSVTQAGGEIVALDLSTYGPLTITGPVTVTAMNGAIITVQTGTAGITVNAGAGNLVTLRNIQISGAAGSSSTTGIKLNTGKLILQNSSMRGLTDALIADSTGNGNSVIRAYLVNVDITGNTRGITTNGSGTDLFVGNSPHPGGNVSVLINGGNILANGTAFTMNSPGQDNGNHLDTMWLAGYSNGTPNTNIIGNAVVVVGTPTSVGGDCQFNCNALRIYLPSSATTNYDPGP